MNPQYLIAVDDRDVDQLMHIQFTKLAFRLHEQSRIEGVHQMNDFSIAIDRSVEDCNFLGTKLIRSNLSTLRASGRAPAHKHRKQSIPLILQQRHWHQMR